MMKFYRKYKIKKQIRELNNGHSILEGDETTILNGEIINRLDKTNELTEELFEIILPENTDYKLFDESTVGEHTYRNNGVFLVFSSNEEEAVKLYHILKKEYFGLDIGDNDGCYIIEGHKNHFNGLIL